MNVSYTLCICKYTLRLVHFIRNWLVRKWASNPSYYENITVEKVICIFSNIKQWDHVKIIIVRNWINIDTLLICWAFVVIIFSKLILSLLALLFINHIPVLLLLCPSSLLRGELEVGVKEHQLQNKIRMKVYYTYISFLVFGLYSMISHNVPENLKEFLWQWNIIIKIKHKNFLFQLLFSYFPCYSSSLHESSLYSLFDFIIYTVHTTT